MSLCAGNCSWHREKTVKNPDFDLCLLIAYFGSSGKSGSCASAHGVTSVAFYMSVDLVHEVCFLK